MLIDKIINKFVSSIALKHLNSEQNIINDNLSFTSYEIKNEAIYLLFSDRKINRGGLFVFDKNNNNTLFFPLYINKSDTVLNFNYGDFSDVVNGSLLNKEFTDLSKGFKERYTIIKFITFYFLKKGF